MVVIIAIMTTLENIAVMIGGVGTGWANIPASSATATTINSTAPLPFIPMPIARLSLVEKPAKRAGSPQPTILPIMANTIRASTKTGTMPKADKSR